MKSPDCVIFTTNVSDTNYKKDERNNIINCSDVSSNDVDKNDGMRFTSNGVNNKNFTSGTNQENCQYSINFLVLRGTSNYCK